MDLENELLKRQSLVQCSRIIKYIGDRETRFADLIRGPSSSNEKYCKASSIC